MRPRVVYHVAGTQRDHWEVARALGLYRLQTRPFSTPADFAAMLDRLRPECIMLEADRAGREGAALMAELRARSLGWPVIILGEETREWALRRSAGEVAAVLPRPVNTDALAKALARASASLVATPFFIPRPTRRRPHYLLLGGRSG